MKINQSAKIQNQNQTQKHPKKDTKPKSETVRDIIVGVTSTTNPLTTATINPITKTTITNPPSQVRSLIPPIAKNIISNVVVSYQSKFQYQLLLNTLK